MKPRNPPKRKKYLRAIKRIISKKLIKITKISKVIKNCIILVYLFKYKNLKKFRDIFYRIKIFLFTFIL